MRAQRAKLKSCKDDMIVAQGKRSAALGRGPKMISSPFSARAWRAAARQARAEKGGFGLGGLLPRAAAAAALPWANILPPLRGAEIGPSYGERPLHEQSHGESFLALLVYRFRGEGLYLLDEPEAALSPSRQLSVITRMHDLVREKSQFIIATQSPILMAYPHAYIYAFSA
jgi:hypothetical protein